MPNPKVTVIERLLAPKTGDDAQNGDAFLVTPSFVCVVDGATPKVKVKEAVRLDVLTAKLVVDEVAMLRAGATAQEAVERITARLRREARRLTPVGQVDADKLLAASAVIVSTGRREIWRVGDCAFRTSCGHSGASRSKIDTILAEARALFNTALISAGTATASELAAHDLGREFIKPMLAEQSVFMNDITGSPYGFGALCGTVPPEKFIEVTQLPNDPVEVILGTDGYPVLLGTLDLSEAHLRAVLSADPLMITAVKATKGLGSGCQSFDDRAYLRFVLA